MIGSCQYDVVLIVTCKGDGSHLGLLKDMLSVCGRMTWFTCIADVHFEVI